MRFCFTSAILSLTTLAVCFGCTRKANEVMEKNYRPADVQSMAEIDVAEGVSYGSDPVEIEGIASEGSGGGWSRDNYWVQHLEFAAWRKVGGPVIDRPLLVMRAAPSTEEFTQDFTPYSSHRVRVLLEAGETRSILLERLPLKQPNAELVAIGEQLKEPVIVTSQLLGDLTLDRSLGWYEGEAIWNGQMIQVTLRPDENGILDHALKLAEKLWSDQAGWKRKVETLAVKELLPLKNDNWLEEGETPLTPEQFTECMSLESISLEANGSFTFWYEDGDLFWGHSIEIRGDEKQGLFDAGIAG